MEELRKEFEKWASKTVGMVKDFKLDWNDTYRNFHTHIAWLAYQEGREQGYRDGQQSVVIEQE